MALTKQFATFAALACALGAVAAPASNSTLETRAYNRHKIGIAADWDSPQSVFGNFKNGNTVASYNWSPWRPDLQPSDLQFWPMLRAEASIVDWPHVTAGYATTAMGCNEVNQAGQAQMSVDRGVQIWRQYLQPLKNQGYKLVSHSTNQAPDGLDWHRAFRSQCPDCHNSIDYYSVHWYGTDANAFKSYVANFYNVVNKPLVITEFACQDFSGQTSCDSAKARSFMDDVTDWMNGQDYIYAYFWFGMWPTMPGGVSQANSLVNGDGTPNSLGQNYMNS